jgi:hypothetical protein
VTPILKPIRRPARIARLVGRVQALRTRAMAAAPAHRERNQLTIEYWKMLEEGQRVSAGSRAWAWLFASGVECPMCGSYRAHRSHRHGEVEFALSPIALPFRCDECGCRYFVPRQRFESQLTFWKWLTATIRRRPLPE